MKAKTLEKLHKSVLRHHKILCKKYEGFNIEIEKVAFILGNNYTILRIKAGLNFHLSSIEKYIKS